MRKTKLKISIKELSFEFEGSQEDAQQVQQGLQQTLASLVSTQARVLALQGNPNVIDAKAVNPTQAGVDTATPPAVNGNGGEKAKTQRKARSGVSLAKLIRALIEEKFFGQIRPATEVIARLKDKGHTYSASVVMTELQRFAKRDELFRANNGENVYVYKDTPFNDANGSQNAAGELAE